MEEKPTKKWATEVSRMWGGRKDGGQTLCCLELNLWNTFVLFHLASSDAHESLTLWHCSPVSVCWRESLSNSTCNYCCWKMDFLHSTKALLSSYESDPINDSKLSWATASAWKAQLMWEHCIQRVRGGWRRGLCHAQRSLSVIFCTEGIFIYLSPFHSGMTQRRRK